MHFYFCEYYQFFVGDIPSKTARVFVPTNPSQPGLISKWVKYSYHLNYLNNSQSY